MTAPEPNADPHAETLNQGIMAEQWGQPGTAVQFYGQVLEAAPDHVEALTRLGRLVGGGNPGQGMGLLRRAIAAEPDAVPAHLALINILLRIGQADEALALAERACTLAPDDPETHATAALGLLRSNRLDAARAAADRALELDPDHAAATLLKATLLREQGDAAAARPILERLLGRDDLDPARRDAAAHELAVVFDKLGEWDAAYETIEACGAVRLATPAAQQQRPQMVINRMRGWREVLTPDLLARHAASLPADVRAPMFVVGFPRSGTTMTEQILAAHPGVVTTGELPLLNLVDQEFRAGAPMGKTPGLIESADAEAINGMRRLYWQRAESVMRAPIDDKLFLDKLPFNIIDVGLINVLFPQSKLIVALRDPRDVCLSCLMQRFGLNVAMVNFLSLERTVAFYAEVMSMWLDVRERLTIPWLEVRYEDTVSDLERHARRLLEFLELPWDDAVLSFHESARDRYILAPSYAAVTEPVHKRAVGRWQNYRRHFEPHLETLRPFVEAFGYDA